MKIISRIIVSVYLVLVLVMGLVMPVCAAAEDENKLIKVTEEIAIGMAERFAEDIAPEKELVAANPVKFYDASGKAIGYIVSYYQGEIPYGYVIFDSTSNGVISEYSIFENVLSPYQVARNNSEAMVQCDMIEETVYKLDPLTYGVLDTVNQEIITNSGASIELPDMEIAGYNNSDKNPSQWSDVFLEEAQIYEDYTMLESGTVEIYTLEEAFIEEQTQHYACCVTALAVCADYYGTMDYNNFSTDYMRLWTLSNTSTDHVGGNGVTYGTTQYSTAGEALISFCAEKNVIIDRIYTANPSYSFFKNCVNSFLYNSKCRE